MSNITGRIIQIIRRTTQRDISVYQRSLGNVTGARNTFNMPATNTVNFRHTSQRSSSGSIVRHLLSYQAGSRQASIPLPRSFHPHASSEQVNQGASAHVTTDPKIAARSLIAQIKDQQSYNQMVDLINKYSGANSVEFRLAVMQEAKQQSKTNVDKYRDALKAANNAGKNNPEMLKEAEKIQDIESLLNKFYAVVKDGTKDILKAQLTNNLPGAKGSLSAFVQDLVRLINDDASMKSQFAGLKQYEQCLEKNEIRALHHALRQELKEALTKKTKKINPLKQEGERRVQLDWKKERALVLMQQLKEIKALHQFLVRLL